MASVYGAARRVFGALIWRAEELRMPRVNRAWVLFLLLFFACAFLLCQLYYFRYYVSKVWSMRINNLTPSRKYMPRILNPAGHMNQGHVQWQTIKTFLTLARRFHLPLFLADTAALSLISHQTLRQQDRDCNFLCTDRPVTSFALLANQWKHDPDLLSTAEQKGFDWMEFRGQDPRLASLDSLSGKEIPLYFLFRLHGYIIQVVFLYERSGMYLWHGALRLRPGSDRNFAPFKQLDYGRHAGVFDRPQLVLTVLDRLDVQVPRNVTRFLTQQKHNRFLECRHHDARHFLQLYPDDSSPPALEFRRKAKLLLQLAARTFSQLDVPFWISSGTCLGWFRQCDIISYSRDVDIGIFISDFRPDIVTALTDAGLKLKHKFGKVEDSLELSFVSDDVKLDIFFFYEDGNFVWNGGTQARSGRKFKYVFPRFSLCWAELLELKVRVPCETLDYVTANYGTNWNVPVKRWDWKSSPSNVQENGVWPVAEWDELIQVY